MHKPNSTRNCSEIRKIIDLRSHKLPEEHREYSLQETEKLLRKGIIRESQSPFNSPLWIVPEEGNKLRMSLITAKSMKIRIKMHIRYP